jgi:hypothetical protein
LLPSRPPPKAAAPPKEEAKQSKAGEVSVSQESPSKNSHPIRSARGGSLLNQSGSSAGRIGKSGGEMGSGSLLKVLAKNFDVLAGPLVALAYPLYASVKAIETKSPVDDQQWLTYWVMYSLITLFELTFASIIQW